MMVTLLNHSDLMSEMIFFQIIQKKMQNSPLEIISTLCVKRLLCILVNRLDKIQGCGYRIVDAFCTSFGKGLVTYLLQWGGHPSFKTLLTFANKNNYSFGLFIILMQANKRLNTKEKPFLPSDKSLKRNSSLYFCSQVCRI